MMDESQRIEQAIAAQESLRATVGDEIVDVTISMLHEKLAQLETPSEALAQQRKLVTILYADIVGSTNIVKHLDPEDALEIMDGSLKRLAGPVEEHGGHVARFMGDGFKAVFGMPKAHENDPEMAIKAGLGILEIAHELGGELETQWGVDDFQVRVGINTGLAVLGGMTEAEDTVMGSTVNLAKRVESASPAEGLLITHDTYRHVRGIFTMRQHEPIEAKGFDEPVPVYCVLGVKPRAFRIQTRGVEGVETRMVGRKAELIALEEAYRNSIEGKQTQVVTLVGEAGVGKSRLLYEFQNWLELLPDVARFFQGRGRQETQNLPYALLKDVFSFRFQIQESDKISEVRDKVEVGFSEVFGVYDEGQMRAHITGQLLGFDFSGSRHLKSILDDPQQIRDRALMYLAEYFQGMSDTAPTVVFLEDIHWSDDSSLNMLSRLARRIPEQQLLIVCVARHRLYERRPYWGEGLATHRRLELQPLSKHDSSQLVIEILQNVDQIPDSLQDLVVKGAEGNPFYIEELIKMLIEDGVIITGEERWRVEFERLAEVEVPDTLTGVLQARLEGLPTEERNTLQQASVVGHIFWDDTINYISTESTASDTQSELSITHEYLSSLRSRELIYHREESAFTDAAEYTFKHAVLRNVIYESVLKKLRRAYHGLVAEWLIQHSHERAGEYTGLIADHLVQAGQTEQAISYLQKAGQEAAARYANDEALAYFSRAIDLADQSTSDDSNRASLYSQRGQVYEMRGDFEGARSDFENTLHLARATGELKGEWRAQLDLGKLWASRDYGKTHDYFEGALELARQLDDPALLARSLNRMGNWYANADYPQEANSYHQEALKIFEQLGDRPGLAGTLDLLGMANTLSGDTFALVEYYDRAIELFRELDDQPSLASSLMIRSDVGSGYEYCAVVQTASPNERRRYLDEALQITLENDFRAGQSLALWILGLEEAIFGRYGAAIERLESGLRIATEIGHRQWMTGNLSALGMVYSCLLAGEKVRQYSEQALALSREVQSKYLTQLAAGTLAKANLLLGDPAQGQVILEEEISDQTPMHTVGNRYCWCRRAELALAQHEPALALDIVERVIEAIPGMSPGRVNTSIWRLRGETLLEMGRTDEAEHVLHAALENARTIGEEYIIWQLHATLGRLYNRTDRQVEAEKAFAAGRVAIEILAANIPDKELRANFHHRANETLGNPL